MMKTWTYVVLLHVYYSKEEGFVVRIINILVINELK